MTNTTLLSQKCSIFPVFYMKIDQKDRITGLK